MPAAERAYVLYPSDAMYPPSDLRLAERLLIDCGLLLEREGRLYPTPEIDQLLALSEDEAIALVLERAMLAAPGALPLNAGARWLDQALALAEELVPDPERREALLLSLGRKYDDASRAALGLRGEDFVVRYARDELARLGRPDLASNVRRLSALADDLGYDVVAPRIGGTRRLEVKTSGRSGEGLFRFVLSRNEIDWGLRDEEWGLVACQADLNGEIELIGWCRAWPLEPYLPQDGEGSRWISTELEVPVTLLGPGLPSAI